MKNKINLKKEFADYRAGFNNSMAPLGGRKDLADFLIMAHRSGRQDYLAMFENPPTLEQLLEAKADAKLEELNIYQAPEAYPTSPATLLAPDLNPVTIEDPARETAPSGQVAEASVANAAAEDDAKK